VAEKDNPLAYYFKEFITAVKSFKVQAQLFGPVSPVFENTFLFNLKSWSGCH